MSNTNNVSQAASRDITGPLLELTDVKTHFRTPRGIVRAVDGVSLTLDRGNALGIVGESGSGKTILSRSIMGLLPPKGSIRSGSIKFEGREIGNLSRKAMRHVWGKEMAMIFQDPMTSLNPLMKIGRQISEPLQIHLGMDTVSARATAEKLLQDVRIPEARRRLDQYPHELSGGMRQRVMIAIALACGPTVLFADEPTTALDVTVQAQILDLLAEQQRERFMAMILVTHDLGVVAGRTDEIIVMYAGQVVERAPTAELFAKVRMPYTEALIASIPSLTAPTHERLRVITGRPPQLVDLPVGCRFAPRCPYVQERCRREEPPLEEGSPGHLHRCWFPLPDPVVR
jgi:peptide/nickel transport system ATP-binding protein